MLPAPEADVEAYLARQIRFDPDLWIVEVEDRRLVDIDSLAHSAPLPGRNLAFTGAP